MLALRRAVYGLQKKYFLLFFEDNKSITIFERLIVKTLSMKKDTELFGIVPNALDRVYASFSVMFVMMLLEQIKKRKIPNHGVNEIINLPYAEELYTLLTETPDKDEIIVTAEKALAFYACIDLSCTIVLSPYGEKLITEMLKMAMKKVDTTHISNFRKTLLKENYKTLNDCKEELSGVPGFSELNTKLSTINFKPTSPPSPHS